MPQGLLEKIQVQLLLADLPLKLGDLTTSLGQVIGLGRHAARLRHDQRLRLGRTAARRTKRLGTADPPGIAPTVDDRPLDADLQRQRRAALASLQPLYHLQLELPAEAAPLRLRRWGLGHQFSSSRTVPYFRVSPQGVTP